MDDKEAEIKVQKMQEMTRRFADVMARHFEDWLNEHQSASKEEAHKQLVDTIESCTMMNTMMLGVML